jgi:hypothetical protein
MDIWDLAPIKTNSAEAFVRAWDVADSRTLYWVDDAFGGQQFRADLVDDWNRRLSELVAATRRGCRLILTTRDYIWSDARRLFRPLDSRLMSADVVVVDVAALTPNERELIIYNHLKLGAQSREFKSAVKRHLGQAAASPQFLPETARRFGDPAFTFDLATDLESVRGFFDRPVAYLAHVIAELDRESHSALGTLFASGGRLEVPLRLRQDQLALLEAFGGTVASLRPALRRLDGSFVRLVTTEMPNLSGVSRPTAWTFRHPTIADAVGRDLASDPEFLGIYIERGSLRDLLGVVTAGDLNQTNSIPVGPDFWPALLERLMEPDSVDRIAVAQFLAARCSDEFLKAFTSQQGLPAWVDGTTPRGLALLFRLHKANALADSARMTSWRTR